MWLYGHFLTVYPEYRGDIQKLEFLRMIRVPAELLKQYTDLLGKGNTPKGRYFNYQKWLRYYLDFCHKYHFSHREKDSLGHFMKKLQEKGQTVEEQKRAADAIDAYYLLLKIKTGTQGKKIPSQDKTVGLDTQTSALEPSGNPWLALYDRLRKEIKVRQYSPKTLQTYAGWIRKFQYFTKSKQPDSLSQQSGVLLRDRRCRPERILIVNSGDTNPRQLPASQECLCVALILPKKES